MILGFIDTEITGLRLDKHEVIEFGILRAELKSDLSLSYVDSYSFRIKPLNIKNADSEALKINGYTEEKWSKAVTQKESLSLIRGCLESCDVLVGQNLICDLRFIRKSFKKYKQKIMFPSYLDTKQMAEDAGFTETSLDYLCYKYNIKGNAHTASGDCERTYKVFLKLLECSIPRYFTFLEPFVVDRNINAKKI